MRAQSQGHHTIDHLEERGMERGSARWSSLKGREGHRQSDKRWNHFKGNVGETCERRGGAHVGFSERIHAVLNWTELNCLPAEKMLDSLAGLLYKLSLYSVVWSLCWFNFSRNISLFLFYSIAFVECSRILVFSSCYVHANVKLFLRNNNCCFDAHDYAFWLCVSFS